MIREKRCAECFVYYKHARQPSRPDVGPVTKTLPCCNRWSSTDAHHHAAIGRCRSSCIPRDRRLVALKAHYLFTGRRTAWRASRKRGSIGSRRDQTPSRPVHQRKSEQMPRPMARRLLAAFPHCSVELRPRSDILYSAVCKEVRASKVERFIAVSPRHAMMPRRRHLLAFANIVRLLHGCPLFPRVRIGVAPLVRFKSSSRS